MSVHPKGSFLNFYDIEFQKRLEKVEIPGLSHASWDRKAAYLLWVAEDNDGGPIGNEQATPSKPKRSMRQLFEEDDFI